MARSSSLALCVLGLLLASALPSTLAAGSRKLLRNGRGGNQFKDPSKGSVGVYSGGRDRDNNYNTNLAANTLRSSIQTSQAIEASVDDDASQGSTQRATVTGSALTWAAGQPNRNFKLVEQATAPNTINNYG